MPASQLNRSLWLQKLSWNFRFYSGNFFAHQTLFIRRFKWLVIMSWCSEPLRASRWSFLSASPRRISIKPNYMSLHFINFPRECKSSLVRETWNAESSWLMKSSRLVTALRYDELKSGFPLSPSALSFDPKNISDEITNFSFPSQLSLRLSISFRVKKFPPRGRKLPAEPQSRSSKLLRRLRRRSCAAFCFDCFSGARSR